MDAWQLPKKRRASPEINLTPILDMLVSIIFFLLIFCVFNQLTQITLPATTRAAGVDASSRRLSAELMILRAGADRVRFVMRWSGESPGSYDRYIARTQLKSNQAWTEATRSFIEEFARKYPAEKTLHLGLDRAFSYQHLVTIIDAVKPKFQELALLSPDKIRLYGTAR